MKPLDGEPMEIGTDEDPRQKLVDWMADPKNPFFARPSPIATGPTSSAAASSIRSTTCASPTRRPIPELLDALAKDLVDHKYSLKHLVRIICQEPDLSAQLDAQRVQQARQADLRPLLSAAHERRGAVRRRQPGDRTARRRSAACRRDKHAPNRAIMLPDESFPSYFLDVFGRPQRISACECERVSEANLAQALHLLNSDEMQGKLTAGNGRADMLAKDPRPDAEKIDELFLWALLGKPSPEQREAALAHIAKHVSKQPFIWLSGVAAMQTRWPRIRRWPTRISSGRC